MNSLNLDILSSSPIYTQLPIDMHCHSTRSDGTFSPSEVVQKAHEKGVKVLSLSDHDTVLGILEARQTADSLGMTLILTVGFCGLSLIFHDEAFLKWKSTVINSVFAVALIISVALGKPLLELAMKNVFRLTQSGWNKLTLAWAGYFLLMAGLQYYFAFFTNNDIWINFKSWGWIPVMLVFLIGQFVFLKNHLNPDIQQQINDKGKN